MVGNNLTLGTTEIFESIGKYKYFVEKRILSSQQAAVSGPHAARDINRICKCMETYEKKDSCNDCIGKTVYQYMSKYLFFQSTNFLDVCGPPVAGHIKKIWECMVKYDTKDSCNDYIGKYFISINIIINNCRHNVRYNRNF